MKKLLMVSLNDHVPWGGSEVLWSEVCDTLLKRGEFEIGISPRKWTDSPAKISALLDAGAKDYRRSGVKEIPLAKARLNRLLPRSKQYMPEDDCFNGLTDFRPDLVVISLGDHNAGAAWMAMCREHSIPYILIVQLVKEGHFVPSSSEHFAKLREGYLRAERILCPSYDNRYLLEKQFASPMQNVVIINNPIVNLPAIPPYPESQIANLAMVASLNPNHKGQDILFDVLRAKKWRERQIQVNLYGSGHFEAILKMLAIHWDLKNVFFHGHTPLSDIWTLNQALILPSRMEGLSLAFLEAMNCERTAIITRVGDSERFIEDNVNGFLIKAPQADMLDEAMERAWARRSDWAVMGKRCRLKLCQEIQEDPVAHVADLVCDALK